MAKVYLALPQGFEETEAVAAVDVMRRGGLEVVTLSLTGALGVEGSHGITVLADAIFGDVSDGDALALPGGPGTAAYAGHAGLVSAVQEYAAGGKWLAAICAAPTALYAMGVLGGRRVTCYPGLGAEMAGVTVTDEDVVTDGRLITSKGPGTAAAFGLAVVRALVGEGAAEDTRRRFCL